MSKLQVEMYAHIYTNYNILQLQQFPKVKLEHKDHIIILTEVTRFKTLNTKKENSSYNKEICYNFSFNFTFLKLSAELVTTHQFLAKSARY